MPFVSISARATLALSLSAALLSAQGVNCRLLGRADKYPGANSPTNNYAGIWGMVVNGREIAVVPARTGTVFYDCTNPGTPAELGVIPGPGSGSQPYFWREAQSRGNYAYISSEHGALQVIDMSGVAPVLAGTFGGSAHTVSIDLANSRLWANGGSSPGGGCNIYNLAANAVNPPLVGSYSASYVHDCLPVGGFTYLAQIFNGNVRILNTSSFPTLATLSTTTTPGAFTHNAWVNDDATLMVTADENRGGCLTIYDITLKTLPVQLATWCSPSGATVHNVFIEGKVAQFSSYSGGFYAVDLSEPATPRLICSYDTSPQTNNDYHGCWGCYPFQPSGVVYLTDMQTGFWIVEPTCGVPHQYGNGTAGTGGRTPKVDYGGGYAQVARTTFKLDCTDMLPNAPLALFVGSAAATTPVFGISLNVDLNQPYVQVVAGANAQGRATVNIPIPALANLAGGTIYAQAVTADVAGPQGLAASRGFRVTICP